MRRFNAIIKVRKGNVHKLGQLSLLLTSNATIVRIINIGIIIIFIHINSMIFTTIISKQIHYYHHFLSEILSITSPSSGFKHKAVGLWRGRGKYCLTNTKNIPIYFCCFVVGVVKIVFVFVGGVFVNKHLFTGGLLDLTVHHAPTWRHHSYRWPGSTIKYFLHFTAESILNITFCFLQALRLVLEFSWSHQSSSKRCPQNIFCFRRMKMYF